MKPQIDEIETQYVEALREKADNMNKIFVNEVTLETFEHLEKIKKQRICDLQIKKDFIFDRIDKNERFLLDADNFWLSKENHRKLLTEADKVCQKISGFFEKRREMLMEKNQLEIQIDVNMIKFHFSKATEANFPLLMKFVA